MFVKICGITNEDDALLAVAMGADAISFVFAPSSRQVAAGHVRDIVRRLPPEILTLGVFRDEAPQRVIEQVRTAGLAGVQLHGHETPEDARWIRSRVEFLIQAFPAGDEALSRSHEWGADAILVDSPTPGSGQIFDWSLAEGAPSGQRIILAGGLNPANVADAIAAVRPWGVDVSTGVEAQLGRKDPRKVRAFIAAAKAAEVRDERERTGALYDWQEEGG